MQHFIVASRRGRCIALLAVPAVFGLMLVVASVVDPRSLLFLAGFALLATLAFGNAVRSLGSSEVALNWDGKCLVVKPPRGNPPVEIDSAQWVFSDGTNIVIRSNQPLPKFNAGHVRCNGRELTADGFIGTEPSGLADIAQTLGPARRWLWRYMPV
jgi:hypothetical protein